MDPMQSATSSSPSATGQGTPPSTPDLSPAAVLAPIEPAVVTPPATPSGLTIRRAAAYPKSPVFVPRATAITPATSSLIYGIAKIQLSNRVDIHNASSKPALANAREEVQSQSSLKRKFDDNGNEEELHRPKKQDCAVLPENGHGPWGREREVLRVMKLGEPGRLALLASTFSSAESRAGLTKLGEPEMSWEEVRAAVRESPSLWERKETPRPAKLSRFEERTAMVHVYAFPTDPYTTYHPTKPRLQYILPSEDEE